MSKITYRKKTDVVQIVNQISYPETVNERINHSIAVGKLSGVCPVKVIPKHQSTQLECTIYGQIVLKDYVKEEIRKAVFLDIVNQIFGIIRKCEDMHLNSNNLDLQSDRIFINPATKGITCIYWPIVNNQNERPAYLFLKDLPKEVRFSSNENGDYIRKYTNFFEADEPFSLKAFERFLGQLMGNESNDKGQGVLFDSERIPTEDVHIRKQQDVVNVPPNAEYRPVFDESYRGKLPVQQHNICPACKTVYPMDVIYCKKCGTRTIQSSKANTSAEKAAGGKQAQTGHLYLIRIRNNEKIPVSNNIFLIGKDASRSHYTIKDNPAVSRAHMRLIVEHGGCFIEDLGSTNGTFLNGARIIANKKILVANGDHVLVANEEFVICIGSGS